MVKVTGCFIGRIFVKGWLGKRRKVSSERLKFSLWSRVWISRGKENCQSALDCWLSTGSWTSVFKKTWCFSKFACFLNPGLKVATNQNFDGRLSDKWSGSKDMLSVTNWRLSFFLYAVFCKYFNVVRTRNSYYLFRSTKYLNKKTIYIVGVVNNKIRVDKQNMKEWQIEMVIKKKKI